MWPRKYALVLSVETAPMVTLNSECIGALALALRYVIKIASASLASQSTRMVWSANVIKADVEAGVECRK